MDDKTLFEKLCQQAQEARLPEVAAKRKVFDALRHGNIGFFQQIFLNDDYQMDPEEEELIEQIVELCHTVPLDKIGERFAPFYKA